LLIIDITPAGRLPEHEQSGVLVGRLLIFGGGCDEARR
jgi:hypothetical protein